MIKKDFTVLLNQYQVSSPTLKDLNAILQEFNGLNELAVAQGLKNDFILEIEPIVLELLTLSENEGYDLNDIKEVIAQANSLLLGHEVHCHFLMNAKNHQELNTVLALIEYPLVYQALEEFHDTSINLQQIIWNFPDAASEIKAAFINHLKYSKIEEIPNKKLIQEYTSIFKDTHVNHFLQALNRPTVQIEFTNCETKSILPFQLNGLALALNSNFLNISVIAGLVNNLNNFPHFYVLNTTTDFYTIGVEDSTSLALEKVQALLQFIIENNYDHVRLEENLSHLTMKINLDLSLPLKNTLPKSTKI